MPNLIYSEEFKIRSSEVDPSGKARLPSICDLLQEVAGSNALELNFDISHLNEQNLTWVIHRLHVQMDRYPEWRKKIIVKTWPSGGDSLRAYRDFLILDTNGNEIGRSLSYWLMLNIESRRPVRIPEEIIKMAPENKEHVLPIRKNRIEVNGGVSDAKTFHISRSDLDLNRHVNNVKYIEWALEALPHAQNVNEIDIEFRAECTYGEQVESRIIKSDVNQSTHLLRRKSDQKIAAVATTR